MIPINDLGRGFRLYQKEYEDKALEVLRSGWYVLGKEVSSLKKSLQRSSETAAAQVLITDWMR